ncbi:MAG TPA: ATP-dependent helicase [Verrucomicrobiales bacterium]|nr:ATP-dependent helicase [Verrucomicrobiales bacterium]HIL70839.1 ATP-dependent helicase [Verrucomicrobiota bacterium]
MAREYHLKPFRPSVDLKIDYEKELNAEQYAAVTAEPGPSLVIAGAGAGKTRTLVYRVAFLLEQGIPPDRILLLTFTNKASREMMNRVAQLIGRDLTELWGGTFHSIGNRILRRFADQFGFRRDFTILDRDDSKELLDACIASLKIDTKAGLFPKAEVIYGILSYAANTRLSIPEVLKSRFHEWMNHTKFFSTLQEAYTLRKKANNVMDFDDLLVLWLQLLRDHGEIRELFQRRFQFILVDEYQDTNQLQSEVVGFMTGNHGNLMVVGDDSQSIYSWRGASFQNMLEFPDRLPKTRVYKIETNYRSTPEILSVANSVISQNEIQFPKQLIPVKDSGIKPQIVVCSNGQEQAAFVAQRLLELYEEGCSLNEIAILYRSHFHSLELQFEFNRRNIPFIITSGIRFFEQAHVKDVLALMKLYANPGDEIAFKRLVKLMKGIGPRSAENLWVRFLKACEVFQEHESTLSEGFPRFIAETWKNLSRNVPPKASHDWENWTLVFERIHRENSHNKTDQLIYAVLEGAYRDWLRSKYINADSRIEDLEQLAEYSMQFESMDEFLSQMALMTNLEAGPDRPDDQVPDQVVRLTTIHQAKGLEFDVVFVITLCEGLFPFYKAIQDDNDVGLEEERRLFYVSVTRARNEVYLSYPMVRMTPNRQEMMQRPSRFLEEIPVELVEQVRLNQDYDYW